MSDLMYLLFSGDGDLAGFGALAADAAAPALLEQEASGRLEIWRGPELVAVVGAPAADHAWGV